MADALTRTLLRLGYGLPPDPADADELGRIFDETHLHGTPPCESCPFAACRVCEWQGGGSDDS